MADVPTIPGFYRNKTIFVTGGSGFIGKVLIEKLLRSCPDLKTIYLLLRDKKGQTPEERIKAITNLPLFEVLKSQNPDSLDKIKIVAGDVRELNLGLNPQDRRMLIDQVNIVFHTAASVRFDENLADAVLMNTRGTREIARLALEMNNLNILVHVSTTYCISGREVIEEKLYPAIADWEKTIQVVEHMDKRVLYVFTEKYMHPHPNTYTFSKSLGENAVYDMCNGKIPLVIYRPSVVINSDIEPMPGWIDNFNGPQGLLVAVGKGLIGSVYADPNVTVDYVPVDVIVKTMIISSWKQATYKDVDQKLTTSVYNGSNNNINCCSIGTSLHNLKKTFSKEPFSKILWYPNARATRCYYNYFTQMMFYRLLPALLIDGLFKLWSKKPILVKIQRKIHLANLAIAYYSLNQWTFINEKMYNLNNDLLQEDIGKFSYNIKDVDHYEFKAKTVAGAKKYLLNEVEDVAKARKHLHRMRILSQTTNLFWYLGLFWVLIFRFSILSVACDYFIKVLL